MCAPLLTGPEADLQVLFRFRLVPAVDLHQVGDDQVRLPINGGQSRVFDPVTIDAEGDETPPPPADALATFDPPSPPSVVFFLTANFPASAANKKLANKPAQTAAASALTRTECLMSISSNSQS